MDHPDVESSCFLRHGLKFPHGCIEVHFGVVKEQLFDQGHGVFVEELKYVATELQDLLEGVSQDYQLGAYEGLEDANADRPLVPKVTLIALMGELLHASCRVRGLCLKVGCVLRKSEASRGHVSEHDLTQIIGHEHTDGSDCSDRDLSSLEFSEPFEEILDDSMAMNLHLGSVSNQGSKCDGEARHRELHSQVAPRVGNKLWKKRVSFRLGPMREVNCPLYQPRGLLLVEVPCQVPHNRVAFWASRLPRITINRVLILKL